MLEQLQRRRPSPALLISLIALFLASGGWGYAANGGSFILGKGNSARKSTALTAKGGPTLALKNTGGKPAASFTVKTGVEVAPFTVNSSAKVAMLNADTLDGSDSSAFLAATGTAANAEKLGGLGPARFWQLAGNTGTSPGTDFVGTKDARALVLKTNNVEAVRVTPTGNVGVGTTGPAAKIEASSISDSSGIAVIGTSTTRGVIGRVGAATSCPGTYGVGGCAGSTGAFGVVGSSDSGTGVRGDSNTSRAVEGFAVSGIGVIGDSSTRGVVGTLGRSSCAGTYAVGGCTGASPGDGVLGRSSSGSGVVGVSETGNIFWGEAPFGTLRVRIDSTGKGFFNGGTQTGGADYAESMPASDGGGGLEPGDVLAIDPRRGYALRKSAEPNSHLVAGVYSTDPSVLAVGDHRVDDPRDGEVPVALLGIVPTKVSTENGPVHAGDLLTTARTPGFAMKASPIVVRGVAIYPTGAILGKALQPLAEGKGRVKVLVTLR